jgi:hypothetical protein
LVDGDDLERKAEINVDSDHPPAAYSTMRKGTFHSHDAVVEGPMTSTESMNMSETELDIPDVPFVSMFGTVSDKLEERRRTDPHLLVDIGQKRIGGLPAIGFALDDDGEQFDSMEIIAQLRFEIVESNVRLNNSRSEVAGLEDEVEELGYRLDTLRYGNSRRAGG